MSSSKYSLYSPTYLLVFSICMALIVIVDVVVLSPMVLRSYDRVMQLDPLEQSRPGFHKEREQSRADFHEEYGYWATSRQTFYASFVLPPIIGFALAITLRKYIRKLVLRNQQYFRKEMRRRPMRYEGLGLNDFRNALREVIPIFPRFLPLLIVIIFLYVLDHLVFPDPSTSAPAFLATCGFISYGTWKRIFKDAMRLESTD